MILCLESASRCFHFLRLKNLLRVFVDNTEADSIATVEFACASWVGSNYSSYCFEYSTHSVPKLVSYRSTRVEKTSIERMIEMAP